MCARDELYSKYSPTESLLVLIQMASPTDTGKLTVLGVGVYSTLIKGVSQILQHFFWYPFQLGHQWLVYKKKSKVSDRSNIVVMFLNFGNHQGGRSGSPPSKSLRPLGDLVQITGFFKLLCGVTRGSLRPLGVLVHALP